MIKISKIRPSEPISVKHDLFSRDVESKVLPIVMTALKNQQEGSRLCCWKYKPSETQRLSHLAVLQNELRDIFENSIDSCFSKQALFGLVVRDDERNVIDCNPACLSLFGCPKEELATHLQVLKQYEGAFKQRYEIQITRRDGLPFWVEVTSFNICNSEGEFLCSIDQLQDISERKEIERNLKEGEDRLKKITSDRRLQESINAIKINAEALKDLQAFISSESERSSSFKNPQNLARVIYKSSLELLESFKEACELSNCEKKEDLFHSEVEGSDQIQPRDFRSDVSPRDLERLVSRIITIAEREVQNSRQSCEWLSYLNCSKYFKIRSETSSEAIHREISEVFENTASSLLFKYSLNGIAIRSKKGELIACNRSCLSMLGCSKEELEIQMQMFQRSSEDFPHKYEVEIARKDGSSFWGQISSSEVRNSSGELICYVDELQDISRRKQKEEKIKEIETVSNDKMRSSIVVLKAYSEELNRRMSVSTLGSENEESRLARRVFDLSLQLSDCFEQVHEKCSARGRLESYGSEEGRKMGLSLDTAKSILKSKRVLIVDDSSVIRKMLKTKLTKLGIVCEEAGNGAIAVQKVQENLEDQPFDLVIMDISMPVMDGLQATREIRKNPQLVNLPIIASTANRLDEETVKEHIEAGMSDSFAKVGDDATAELLFTRMAELILTQSL